MAKRRAKGKATGNSEEAVAYHEAGHAVIAFRLGCALRGISIIPNHDQGSDGHSISSGLVKGFDPDADCNDAKVEYLIKREIIVFFAGERAESKFTRRRNPIGASSDYHAAVGYASKVCGSTKQIEHYLAWLDVTARDLVSDPNIWGAISGLAKLLLEKKQLSGRQAKQAIQRLFVEQCATKSRTPNSPSNARNRRTTNDTNRTTTTHEALNLASVFLEGDQK